ncbi:hypothetical protein F2P79_008709 [Pimephales promelas]|nr:hypothetical protein F2P79_008709 [Pimephales promelas]
MATDRRGWTTQAKLVYGSMRCQNIMWCDRPAITSVLKTSLKLINIRQIDTPSVLEGIQG